MTFLVGDDLPRIRFALTEALAMVDAYSPIRPVPVDRFVGGTVGVATLRDAITTVPLFGAAVVVVEDLDRLSKEVVVQLPALLGVRAPTTTVLGVVGRAEQTLDPALLQYGSVLRFGVMDEAGAIAYALGRADDMEMVAEPGALETLVRRVGPTNSAALLSEMAKYAGATSPDAPLTVAMVEAGTPVTETAVRWGITDAVGWRKAVDGARLLRILSSMPGEDPIPLVSTIATHLAQLRVVRTAMEGHVLTSGLVPRQGILELQVAKWPLGDLDDALQTCARLDRQFKGLEPGPSNRWGALQLALLPLLQPATVHARVTVGRATLAAVDPSPPLLHP